MEGSGRGHSDRAVIVCWALRQSRRWLGGPPAGLELLGRAVIARQALWLGRKWSGGPFAGPNVVRGPPAGS